MAMQWRRTVLAESFEVIGRGVALVPSKSVLRVNHVPLFHAGIAMRFGEDGRGGDGNAAGVAFDERILLDEDVELPGVDEQIIRLNGELLQGRSHGLAAGLIDVSRIDALGGDFSEGPGDGGP